MKTMGDLITSVFIISTGLIGMVLLYIKNDSIKTKWLRISANMLPLVVALVLIALARWQK